MKASAIILEVSHDLNDQIPGYEYTRWTRNMLLSYMREAFYELSMVYKRPFLEHVVVKVESGSGWQRACECTFINRILGLSDADGNIYRNLMRTEDNEDNVWPGSVYGCLPQNGTVHVERYSVSETDSRYFRVLPPVVPGTNVYVVLECYREPDMELTMDQEIPDRFVAAIKQWMLFRALMLDSENNTTIISVAKQHEDVYFSLYKVLAAEWQDIEEKQRHGNSIRTAQDVPARQVSGRT